VKRGSLTGCPLWSWRGIGLILGTTGGMRELADGLPQLAVRHGAKLEGVEGWLGEARNRR
jgi:hypothetical protein